MVKPADEPQDQRARSSEPRKQPRLLTELQSISARAAQTGLVSDAADFQLDWTTDDMLGPEETDE